MNQANKHADRGVAAVAALAGVTTSFGASGNSMGLGVGSYGGESALALKYAHQFRLGEGRTMIGALGAATQPQAAAVPRFTAA